MRKIQGAGGEEGGGLGGDKMDAHRGLPRKCPSYGRRGARPERGGLAAKAGREVGERVVADKKNEGREDGA